MFFVVLMFRKQLHVGAACSAVLERSMLKQQYY
jgi:hypothetical protein